jgi:hypothetical protein
MEKVNVVGVDVGFGNTKIYTSSGGRKFPTLISPAKGEALGESETIMLPGGKEYEIGTLVGAVETRSQDFFLSPEFRALVYYSLSMQNYSISFQWNTTCYVGYTIFFHLCYPITMLSYYYSYLK